MLIPEIKLKRIIDSWLLAVENDYNIQTDEKNSFLYKIFSGNVLGTYDFFTQAKALIIRSTDHPRKLQTRIFFDSTRASIPTIHITLPSDSPYSDSIGFNPNYGDALFTDDNTGFQIQRNRNFNTRFNVVATSDNTFEVLILYYLLKAMIVGNYETLELNGLRNVKISGQDLMIDPHLMPSNVFMRGLILDIFYEFTVPQINLEEMLADVEFAPAIVYGEAVLGLENL